MTTGGLADNKSGLPGKFKAWLYQHGILPRILWPLLVYKFPISTVEGLERRVSSHLRHWLGLPRSLSSIAFYGNKNKLTLPINSLTEEFMVTRAPDGKKPWTGRSRDLSCGRHKPTASNSSFSLSMMSCPARRTSSVGARSILQLLPCAKEEELWSTS